ncbi:hypothetical protein ABZP36_000722 [Zizania latifolia]
MEINKRQNDVSHTRVEAHKAQAGVLLRALKAAMATRCFSSLALLSPSSSCMKTCPAAVRASQHVSFFAACRRARTHLSVATGGEQLVTAQEASQGEFLQW